MPTTVTGDTGVSQIQAGATSGGLPVFQCRAWVNFDGTRNVTNTGASTNGQPVFIRASGNVTSVVKNAVGDYTVNFTTAMPDANYAAVYGYAPTLGGSGAAARNVYIHTLSASSCRIVCRDNAGAGADFEMANIAIFR